MAFSFANIASEAAAMDTSIQSGSQVRDGPDLQDIPTKQIGFKQINGDVKAQLLSTPWPAEDPPKSTAQLLSVASSQGILAAAGPDALVISLTDDVRQVLKAKDGGNIRKITPVTTIPHEGLTHVAFTSDDSVLVASGLKTNGLIAYQVDKLKSGQVEVALHVHLPVTLRTMVPNPNPNAAHLIAMLGEDKVLYMADLQTGRLVEGADGSSMGKDMTCVSWSNRGKQLAAGTTSGAAVQLKPDGEVTAHIPKSTSIPDDLPLSTIVWLENDSFLAIYAPESTDAAEGIPQSEYYVIERTNKTVFTFQKLPEVVAPWGVERLPTHHFLARLHKFDPHIKDLLIVAATTSTDVSVLSKSSKPLSADDDPDALISDEFALTSIEDRQAALPLSTVGSLDTSPIGMAIDLSSKETVPDPIPSSPEIQETAGPVPNLLVLNTEGVLCSWWVIYNDSVEQKTTFSGFDTLQSLETIRSSVSSLPKTDLSVPPSAFSAGSESMDVAASQPNASSTVVSSPSGTESPSSPSASSVPKLQPSWSSFGTGSGFGNTTKIGEDKSSWTNTGFGSTPSTSGTGSAFGQTAFGLTPSTSGTGSAFGQTGFGQSSFGTSSAASNTGSTRTFGATTSFGSKPSGFTQTAAPAFGQSSFGATPAATSLTDAKGSGVSSGFASFAGSGGFGSAGFAQQKEAQHNTFAKPTASGGFASFAGSGGFGGASGKQDASNESPFSKSSGGSGFAGFGAQKQGDGPFSKASGSNSFGQGYSMGAFGNAGSFSTSPGKNETSSAFGTAKPFSIGSSFKGDGTAKDDLPAPTGGTGGFGFGSGFGNMLGETKKAESPAHTPEAEMADDKLTPATSETKPHQQLNDEANGSANEPSKQFVTPPSTMSQSKATPMPPVSSLFNPPQQQQTTPQPATTGLPFFSTTPKETPFTTRPIFGNAPASTTPATEIKKEPFTFFNTTPASFRSGDRASDVSNDKLDSPRVKTEPPSDDEAVDMKSIPEAPLPPDFVTKSARSSKQSPIPQPSKVPEDAPLPPDFLPTKNSGSEKVEESNEEALPEDDDREEEDFISDFEDSGEDVTGDISPVDDASGDQDQDATTEHLESSPASSFKAVDTISPTGGLFTKPSTQDTSKPTRTLFGEVSRPAPVFPPPKPTQQSPRSPSPVRPFGVHDALRPDNRVVSAPLQTRSAIDHRKQEYSSSAIAAQAAQARGEEAAREKARLAALKVATEKAKEEEMQRLEDDEDERIQRELLLPVQPSKNLDEFITYQTGSQIDTVKTDIPAQIERLYQDINSMICTIGINARSLSSFMMYQKTQTPNQQWPGVLDSINPTDALNQSWALNDIYRLREGTTLLAKILDRVQIQSVNQKLESCQTLLNKDLFDLRTKIITIRKQLYSKTNASSATAPLSAEQASIQHDLRKASAAIQMKLVQVEDALAVARSKLTEVGAATDVGQNRSAVGSHSVQRKPTVEAVANTVAKMISMAEKKSADIDVLEAQLKKLDVSVGDGNLGAGQNSEFMTPRRLRTSIRGTTPGSGTSSMFYTPDSKLRDSARSARSLRGEQVTLDDISAEDRTRWKLKAERKRAVAATLQAVLEDKRRKGITSS